MPLWSRWMVRMALIYLLLGLGLRALASVPAWAWNSAWLTASTPTLFHLLVVGWATQTIFGVAYWMFPRVAGSPLPGSDVWSAVVFLSLNLGLILRLVAEPMVALSNSPVWSVLLFAAALLQWVSGMVFVATIWKRVKEKK